MSASLLDRYSHPCQLVPNHPRPIVVVGSGGIVKDAHLPAYRKAGLPVWGLYDASFERAEALGQSFGLTALKSLEGVPDDAVFDVAVPAGVLGEVLAQLPRGAAVLVQKPFGSDLEAARMLLALIRERDLTVAVNFQLRFSPQVMMARHLIAQGAIGPVHDLEVRVTVNTPWHLWTFLQGAPRVEILYHSVHYVDMIRSFFGEPSGVYAKTVRHPRMAELAPTCSTIILDYGDFRRATVTTNHGHLYGPEHEESYIKWEGADGAIKATLGLLMDYPTGRPDGFYLKSGAQPWREIPIEGSWFPDGFIGTMGSLQSYLEGSLSALPTSATDAALTMATVEAAYASSAGGGTPVPSVT